MYQLEKTFLESHRCGEEEDNLLIDPSHLNIGLSIFNTEILRKNGKTNQYSTPQTEKKLCKVLLHKELLITQRNVKRYPKGFTIVSRVLEEVNKDIHRLKKQCKNLKVQLVNNLSDKYYKTTYAAIRNKVRYMEKSNKTQTFQEIIEGQNH